MSKIITKLVSGIDYARLQSRVSQDIPFLEAAPNVVPYEDHGVPLMKLKDDIKPVTYLKNNASQLVRTVSEQGRTVTITQNGEAKAVLMDVAIYDRWKQAAILMKLIAQGEADVAAGRTLSEREAFARAERAIERASRGG